MAFERQYGLVNRPTATLPAVAYLSGHRCLLGHRCAHMEVLALDPAAAVEGRCPAIGAALANPPTKPTGRTERSDTRPGTQPRVPFFAAVQNAESVTSGWTASSAGTAKTDWRAASRHGYIRSVGGRRGLTIVLISALVFSVGGGALALGEEHDYRARAYVIQVPAALGPERGVELARSERVLDQAIALADVEGVDARELWRHSMAESTSRLDIALTVEADRPQQAISLATAYAKAVRRSIPNDEGLPTRGVGARRAEGGLGPLRWPLIGALVGLVVGAALAIIRDGLRRGSAPAPRPASAPNPRARGATRG
jgi:hypothetical protein